MNQPDQRQLEADACQTGNGNVSWRASAEPPVEGGAALANQERATHALREAERLFRAVFNQQFQFMVILATDGTVLDANDTCFRTTGVAREQVMGRLFWETPWWERLPTMQEKWRRIIVESAGAEAPIADEMEYCMADGTVRHTALVVTGLKNEAGQVTKLIVEGRDDTRRRRADAALRQSEQRWRTMAETLPNLLWTDLPDGQCDWLSSQWGQYTGIPEQELLGMRWLDRVIHPDDRQRAAECWQAACADRGDYDLEYRIRRHDGQYRWFQTRGVPVRDESGKIVYWFGTCTDIEDHKRAEETLKEADRRKDEFLATLAHELRNPLAPLRNGLELMRLAQDNQEMLEQARAMMDRQLGQMVRLIDDLLDVSRISRGRIELRRERVELAEVLRQAIETSRPLIEAGGHQLIVEESPTPVIVEADLMRMSQVFSNLLNNAAKYTPSGGQIVVAIAREDGGVAVSVRDTGVGIPAAMLPRVFEMFAQVDRSLERSQGGLGIGLSLVKKLVEMHGGSVEARSEGHGKGSEFVVRLPTVGSPSDSGRSDSSEQADAPASRRVLVVDDNVDAALSMAMMLKVMGNETRTAHDGLQAIEVAADYRPDVVLLDIGMPKLNGYEAARRIREQPWGREMVLAAITGWGQDDDRRRSLEAGFDHHLVKPIDLAALQKLLRPKRP